MNKQFHNRYFGLRHGLSEANEKAIIISHPDNGILSYGLAEKRGYPENGEVRKLH